MAYQNTGHELSFGNEQFGDNTLVTHTLEVNIPYTIRMNQVKEDYGLYVFRIFVDESSIFEETNLSPDFSSSTDVYFSSGAYTSLGNDAKVENVMIFNGRKDGNYHGTYVKNYISINLMINSTTHSFLSESFFILP